jgi:hypothetical protein
MEIVEQHQQAVGCLLSAVCISLFADKKSQ